MSRIFGFGETVEGYAVPVLNEREVRASAGILFFFAMVSFMNAWMLGDFRLTLMFFESAFGICLGCKVYNRFNQEQAQLCPGGSCELPERQEIQKIGPAQALIVIAFLAMIVFVARHMSATVEAPTLLDAAPATERAASGDCTPPDWAVAMGHAEKWKLHHNCK